MPTITGEFVGSSLSVVRIGSSVANATTTLADVTGMVANLAASSTYAFEFTLLCSTTAAAGFKIALDGTVGVTSVNYTLAVISGSDLIFNNRTALGDAQVVTDAGNSGSTALVYGTIVSSTAGTLQLRFAAGAGGTATVVRGSWMEVWKL